MMHRAPLWVNFFAIAVLAGTCAASPMATTLSPPLPKIDFIGPPDAAAPLVLAIAVLRRINTTLAAGGEPPLTELRRAERLLESASFDPRTYEPNSESPTNAHGIIVTGISLGRFLDQRGYRADAHRTWGVVVHTADRAEPAPPSERRALKLYVDKRYVESFEVFAHWRRSLGLAPDLDIGGSGRAYLSGLEAGSRGQWQVAAEDFHRALRGPNAAFRDGHLALGEVDDILGHHRDADAEWLTASALSTNGGEPPYTSVSIDALRLLLHH